MARVKLDRITKIYGGTDGLKAVDGLDLDVADGEFMVLVGPSGCGKTTALRMVAGLEEISAGDLTIGDRIVNHTPARDRDIAMVFQSYALYPHLSVYDNIAFGLKLRKMPKPEIDERVREAARILDLEEFLDRKPRALSGGQRQRVAMGRAIVRKPAAFLMDEPLSNLDAKLRVQTRAEIARLQRDLGVTTLYVTHDQVEALTMGDRVAVMRKGLLQQVAPPQELYDRPVNIFVAGFIGSPSMNMLSARLSDDGKRVQIGAGELEIDDELLQRRPELTGWAGRELIVGIRPEEFEDASLTETRPGRTLRGTIRLREALGAEIMAHLEIDARSAETAEVRELAADAGASQLERRGRGATIVGRFGARSQAQLGEIVELAVDTRSLHFFDPATGRGIYDQPTQGAPS